MLPFRTPYRLLSIVVRRSRLCACFYVFKAGEVAWSAKFLSIWLPPLLCGALSNAILSELRRVFCIDKFTPRKVLVLNMLDFLNLSLTGEEDYGDGSSFVILVEVGFLRSYRWFFVTYLLNAGDVWFFVDYLLNAGDIPFFVTYLLNVGDFSFFVDYLFNSRDYWFFVSYLLNDPIGFRDDGVEPLGDCIELLLVIVLRRFNFLLWLRKLRWLLQPLNILSVSEISFSFSSFSFMFNILGLR